MAEIPIFVREHGQTDYTPLSFPPGVTSFNFLENIIRQTFRKNDSVKILKLTNEGIHIKNDGGVKVSFFI